MAIHRHVVKSSLGPKTKTFIADNIQAIEQFLAPTVHGFAKEITKLAGPRGRVLELSFREATTAWEKFFWASLGYYWIKGDLSLEEAVRQAEEDLLALSNVLHTVVVPAQEVIDPSITCPISISVEVSDSEILEEMDEDLITLDPTEEVIKVAGPEEPTVVEGIRGRPKF